jgi:transposase
MSKSHRKYTKEFKMEALQLLTSSEKSMSAIERDLGITQGLLSKWRRKYQVNEETQGLELSDLASAEAEIKQLRRELAIAREEREILKKAVSIFSKNRP